jgi:hypothetical protein
MTRRGLWAGRVVFTLLYLGAVGAWMAWLDSVARAASVWQRVGLLLASGVVWFLAGEVRAMWKAKPNPHAKTWAQWRARIAELHQQRRESEP